MTGFVALAALMTLAALAFVLPPLLRRRAAPGEDRDAANAAFHREQLAELDRERASGTISEAAFAESRREIERRLLEDVPAGPAPAPSAPGAVLRPAPRGLALALGVLVPAVAVGGYLWLGAPAALDPMARIPAERAHQITPEQVAAMVERLVSRLERNPEDREGWTMLARSRIALGQYDEALKAFEKLVPLAPGDATVLADYADAMAMARGRRLAGEPRALVTRALQIDPRHIKALALAGSAAFEAGEYAQAVELWERMVAIVGADTDFGRQVAASIGEARVRGQLPAGASAASAASAAGAVSGVVRLAPALAAQVSPGDTVFVFARPAEGSRMPVAVLRTRAERFPLPFTLDDASAMSPAARLSAQAKVVIEARVSKSGDATPRKGDLRGVSAVVSPGAAGVEVLIDQVAD